MKPLPITFLISSLGTGGAQMMLYKLLSHLDRSRFSARIISLTPIDSLGERFEDLDLPITYLNLQRQAPNPMVFYQLVALLRRVQPALIQTWMYHADLLGGLAAKMAGGLPVIWNIRHSDLNRETTRRTTLMTAHLCARFSQQLPARIICCAEAALQTHAGIGYALERMKVIPNGFDLSTFRPDAKARREVRKEHGIPADAPLIALVARFHPLKDHATFFQAATLIWRLRPEVHFILCGDDISLENRELSTLARGCERDPRLHLLGRRKDIPRLTAACDLALSSSSGEAFSNSLGEAMACAIPCIATRVGDSAAIIGDTGRLVPPGAPDRLAAATLELLELAPQARAALGQQARRRVMEQFSLARITDQYQKLYQEVIESRQESLTRRNRLRSWKTEPKV